MKQVRNEFSLLHSPRSLNVPTALTRNNRTAVLRNWVKIEKPWVFCGKYFTRDVTNITHHIM